jgi:hypothetical protein
MSDNVPGGGSVRSSGNWLRTLGSFWFCVCCHHVPAVSLAELLTAGMFGWKLLQQTGFS